MNKTIYLVCGTSLSNEDIYSLRKAFDSKEKAEAEFYKQRKFLLESYSHEETTESLGGDEDGVKYFTLTSYSKAGKVQDFLLDMQEVKVL